MGDPFDSLDPLPKQDEDYEKQLPGYRIVFDDSPLYSLDFLMPNETLSSSPELSMRTTHGYMYDLLACRSEESSTKKRRENFTPLQREMLNQWLEQHESDPYPTMGEVSNLAAELGLTKRQIRVYLMNGRRRRLNRSGKVRRRDSDSKE